MQTWVVGAHAPQAWEPMSPAASGAQPGLRVGSTPRGLEVWVVVRLCVPALYGQNGPSAPKPPRMHCRSSCC